MSTADLVARCEPSVALIKGKVGTGTGFLVRPGILATNSHVIAGEKIANLEVRFPSADPARQGPMSARLLYQDTVRDLAFLAVETNLPPLEVAGVNFRFRKGEDVTVIGNPGIGGQMLLENAISRGIVGSMTRLNGRDLLQLDMSINPGNSGGPVLDGSGKVIGVVSLKTSKQEGLAFCVPAADLNAGLAVAEARGTPGRKDSPPAKLAGEPKVGSPGDLIYGWKVGETYVYDMEFTIDGDSKVVAIQGTSVYRVKAADDDGITLDHRGWLVTRSRDKQGMLFNGEMSGPHNGECQVEMKIDRKGNVLSATGSSPLPMLGDLSMLVIEPLPDAPQTAWEESKSITLNEVQQNPGSAGGGLLLGRPDLRTVPRGLTTRSNSRLGSSPRSRLGGRIPRAGALPPPQPSPPTTTVTPHAAEEQTRFTLGAARGDTIPITKTYELTTQEIVGDEPRLKMTGDGTIDFDTQRGLPVAVSFRAKIVENSPNITTRVPISLTCRLLNGDEQSRALRTATLSPTPMNRVEETSLKKLLLDLEPERSSDTNRCREACSKLRDAAPIEALRNDVAHALERIVKDHQESTRGEALRALGVWGDDQTADQLLPELQQVTLSAREELFDTLARLQPSEAVAAAVALSLESDPDRAARTLRAYGPIAEPATIKILQESKNARARIEACRILNQVGTAACQPALEALAARKANAELGRIAAESIQRIVRRHPNADEWAAIQKNFQASDADRRHEAVKRITEIAPAGPMREIMARELEQATNSDNRWLRDDAIRALKFWADEKTGQFVVEQIAAGRIPPSDEALDLLKRFATPDSTQAKALVDNWLQPNRGIAIQALEVIGPAAEKPIIEALQTTTDFWTRGDLCKLLEKIGTQASLPALKRLAEDKQDHFVRGGAANAIKAIETRPVGGPEIGALLSDLKSTDHGRREQALKHLATMKPTDDRRKDVARALDSLLEADVFLRRQVLTAMTVWGDEQTAKILAAPLERKERNEWTEKLAALIAIRPDDRTLALAASWIGDDSRRIIETLRPYQARAASAVLAIVQSGGDARARSEACRALGDLGTPETIPALQILADQSRDEELAREAENALNSVAKRR